MLQLTSLNLTAIPGHGFPAEVRDDETGRVVATVTVDGEEPNNAVACAFAAAPKLVMAAQIAYELLLSIDGYSQGRAAQLLHRALLAARQPMTP